MVNNHWVNWNLMVSTKGKWRQVMELTIALILMFSMATFIIISSKEW